MDDLFQHLLTWIRANPGWAYCAVFSVALVESLAVIGLLVPGVVLMIGAGALIAAGGLDFWPTCAAAATGAIAGDSFSYWLGRHYRHRIRRIWPVSRYPGPLDQGVAFFARHGIWSVAFGRFFGPVRAVIPLIAGMLAMPARHFVLANAGSALVWAPAYLAPGIVFGASLKLAAEAATRLVLLIALLLLLLWLASWGARYLFRRLGPHARNWSQALPRRADPQPGVGHRARVLVNPLHPAAGALATLLLFASLAIGLTLGADWLGARSPGLTYPAPVAASVPAPIILGERQWRERGDPRIAARRQGLWRGRAQPLNLHYAGDLAALARILAPLGWRSATPLSWTNAIKLLSPSLPLRDLPVIPRNHAGRHEALALVRDTADGQLLALRLWASGYRIDPLGPLWIGHVTALRKDRVLNLMALPVTDDRHPDARPERLAAELATLPGLRAQPGDPLRLSRPSAAARHAARADDRVRERP